FRARCADCKREARNLILTQNHHSTEPMTVRPAEGTCVVSIRIMHMSRDCISQLWRRGQRRTFAFAHDTAHNTPVDRTHLLPPWLPTASVGSATCHHFFHRRPGERISPTINVSAPNPDQHELAGKAAEHNPACAVGLR